MATATLEMNNPYAKIGLKRRPTYNEIINLIDENETITGNLPDRTATFYKASPEGSFFDGTDALELLKEQQSRILQRQMQDLLLRQNVRANGGTFNLERHLQSTSSSSSDTSSSTELQQDRGTLSLGLQADLQRREAQLRDRQQQTGEAHRSLISRATTPIIDGLFSLGRQRSVFPTTRASTPSEVARTIDSSEEETPASRPPQQQPATPETFVIGSSSESEPAMMTAREEPSKANLLKNISYSTNITNWSEGALAFQLFVRGRDVNSPEWSLEGLKKKGGGRNISKRQHYKNLAQSMIDDGSWDTRVEAELLKKRISDFKPKGKGSASSSSK